jgi:hypothetical protein
MKPICNKCFEDFAECTCKPVESVSPPAQEVSHLHELFSPLGDNHHNAAKCPYCNPDYVKQCEAQIEVVNLKALSWNG